MVINHSNRVNLPLRIILEGDKMRCTTRITTVKVGFCDIVEGEDSLEYLFQFNDSALNLRSFDFACQLNNRVVYF